jgi:hypothetical protein
VESLIVCCRFPHLAAPQPACGGFASLGPDEGLFAGGFGEISSLDAVAKPCFRFVQGSETVAQVQREFAGTAAAKSFRHRAFDTA